MTVEEKIVLPLAKSVVSITDTEPFDINATTVLNTIMEINKEVVGLIKQKSQYVAVLNEIDRIERDIRSEKLRTIYFPTIGNLLLPYNTHDPYVLDILSKNREQFDNVVKGIIGQIKHRRDIINENIIRFYRITQDYMKNNHIVVTDDTMIYTPAERAEELPTLIKEKKKREKKI